MHPGAFEVVPIEPQPDERVVIPARCDHPCTPVQEPRDPVLPEPQRVRVRDRTVVDVPGDGDDVDVAFVDERVQPVEECAVLVREVDAVQPSAQVPVGGVEDPHALHSSQRARTRACPCPCTP